MTKEEKLKEKKLLLNVLKDGLPYGLKLQITDVNEFTFNGELRVLSKNWCRLNIADPVKRVKVKNQTIPLNCIYIKPYLRPMSSMTDDEKSELWFLLSEGRTNIELNSNGQLITRDNVELGFNYPFVCPQISSEYVDWLNAHHFDYRGLIEKGLALEAPKDMYK